jgi:ubiquinone/menaquinone biosynthesis C-methylase UbiE
MEHVENINKYLGEIYRLLKPGGVFIWTTPCANAFSAEHIFSYLTNQIKPGKDGTIKWRWEESSHLRRFTSKKIKGILLKRGFSKVDFRFRAHFFSFIYSHLPIRLNILDRIMELDYILFKKFPNGASMIGCAKK